jgi:hypothetical protein
MKFISHRGNIDKIDKREENNPEKILFCLSLGYDVELDVWNIDNKFYLGHDEPQYEINKEFLLNNGLWCHAKNLNALESMLKLNKVNCFWHQTDDFTITSQGHIWTFPDKDLTSASIAVMPEHSHYKIDELKLIYGICSDKIELYRNEINKK